MQLDILTPEQKVYSGEVTAVNVPGASGAFEIETNHAPIVSNLGKGYVTIRKAGKEEKFLIEGGIVEVLNNKVIVLADTLLN